MYWVNIVDMHQAPSKSEGMVKIAAESYRDFVNALEMNPEIAMTINVSGCLLDQLQRYGFTFLIDGIGRLVERGQVELTASAMFHPILPLIGFDEARRQMELDHQRKRQYFGALYNPQGFFLPEMCYSLDIAEIIASYGYKYLVMDEIGLGGRLGNARDDVLYEVDGLPGFYVFFRDRRLSIDLARGTCTTAGSLAQALGRGANSKGYTVTAVDGGSLAAASGGTQRAGFGSSVDYLKPLLEQGLNTSGIATVTLGRLLSLFTTSEKASPLACSWTSWEDEVASGIAYPQWRYPTNEIHSMQWRLTYLLTSLVEMLPGEAAHQAEARSALDVALSSEQYRWASCRPWWDTRKVIGGANQLLGVVALAAPYVPEDKVTEARQIFADITHEVQVWEATGKAQRLAQEYFAKYK